MAWLKNFILRRARFFRWWIGVYYAASGAAIIYTIHYYEEQSFRVSMYLFGQFWLSVGLYRIFRDPIKAEKAVWDAVEKDQRKEKVAENAGVVSGE